MRKIITPAEFDAIVEKELMRLDSYIDQFNNSIIKADPHNDSAGKIQYKVNVPIVPTRLMEHMKDAITKAGWVIIRVDQMQVHIQEWEQVFIVTRPSKS